MRHYKRNLPGDMTLENVWPEETCPQCGGKFYRRCSRREWGYWYNASESQLTSQLTLLCSHECSRKYAEARLLEDVRRTMRSKCAQAIRLVETEHMTTQQAARKVGLTNPHSLESYEISRWKELDWLREHNWEVPA